MPRDGTATRQRILDAAHTLIIEQGYAATSVDEILASSGATKGAFFHHFESKEGMAGALYDQYIAGEERTFEQTFRRAERLTSDPLQQVLITIGLFEEMFAPLEQPHPGCLMASFVYQNALMTPERSVQSRAVFMMWRDAIGTKLRDAERLQQPRVALDHDALADMLQVVFEGGFIMAKVLGDGGLIVRYLRVLRSYIEVVFEVDHVRVEPALASS
jgi:AcrR family transcriptional regulator